MARTRAFDMEEAKEAEATPIGSASTGRRLQAMV
jgi:hypothetical protein